MISDLHDRAPARCLNTQICIVGAGPAGLMTARVLSAHGVRTVLLESGGDAFDDRLHALGAVEQRGKPNNGVSAMRYRAFGGTSTRWGGQVLPFFPVDFAARPWLGLDAWPVTFDELAPHYEAALDFFGLSAVLRRDADLWAKWGLAEPQYGDELPTYSSWWCPVPDVGALHRRSTEADPNIDCILRATVTAIALEGDRIGHVAARNLGGDLLEVRADHFVFATGAVEVARLLLQPLADGSDPPWARSGILGGYFQDHPACIAGVVRPADPRRFRRRWLTFRDGRIKYQPRVRLSDGVQRERETLNVGGIVLPKSNDLPLIEAMRSAGAGLLRGRVRREALATVARRPVRATSLAVGQAWEYLVRKRGPNPADAGFELGVALEQLPVSGNRLSLTDERDAFGQRRAALAWSISDAEVRTVAVFAERFGAAMRAQGLGTLDIAPDVLAPGGALKARLHDQGHHIGTARMGRSASEGVVDADLRLFAVPNGHVASAAAFPTSSFSNPTHTIVAFAHRLGEHLARKYAR